MRWAVPLVVLLGATGLDRAGTGALLPVQDRAGDPGMAAQVEEALRARLLPAGATVDPLQLRDAMRRLRLRDPSSAPPGSLTELGVELGADWFFAATLHEFTRQPVPQITLSAQVITPGSPVLTWAGFAAASGLDGRRVLGRGLVHDPGALARATAVRLADQYLSLPGSQAEQTQVRASGPDSITPARSGFLREPVTAGGLGRVAVIPFDSLTDRDAGLHGALMTDLALAVLSRRGVQVVQPALVAEILRRRGVLSRGELDPMSRTALAIGAKADHIFTGTVETYRPGAAGLEPDPWISLSARALDVDSGRILWTAGLERRGSDHPGLFKTGRIHAAGALGERMMEALVGGLLRGSP